MMSEISREEALAAFAKRTPGASPADVEQIFDQWLDAGCLDFARAAGGRLLVRLMERRTRQ